MAQTQTELYNIAAQALGARGNLVSTLGRSRFIDVFNLWLPQVRPLVLKAAHWPSAQKSAALSPTVTRADNVAWAAGNPTPGAKYAFMAPPDMLHPRFLTNFGHFSFSMVDGVKTISTHLPSPILNYTFDQTDIGLWEPELFLVIAKALAAHTAMTLTGKQNLARTAAEDANAMLITARGNAADTQNEPTNAVASWHAARGYYGRPDAPRFVYPLGALIAVGESASVQ